MADDETTDSGATQPTFGADAPDAEAQDTPKDTTVAPDETPKTVSWDEHQRVLKERDEHKKRADDARSVEIGKLREFQRGEPIEDLVARFDALEEAIKSGELEAYPTKVASVRAERQANAFKGELASRAQETEAAILAVAKELGVDANTSEDFDTARVYFNAARRAAASDDPQAAFMAGYLLGNAKAEALAAQQKALTKKHADDLKAEFKKGQKAAVSQQERASAGDLSTGTPSGGGSGRVTRSQVAAMNPAADPDAWKKAKEAMYGRK